MVLSGVSIGCVLAYGLKSFGMAQLIVGFVASVAAFYCSQYLRLDYDHRLMDTLERNGYDRFD